MVYSVTKYGAVAMAQPMMPLQSRLPLMPATQQAAAALYWRAVIPTIPALSS